MRADLRTLAVVVALALLVLLPAGCGQGQTKADRTYVEATDRVVRAFDADFQQLQAHFTAVSTPPQDIGTLGRLSQSVDQVVAELRQVNAPGPIAPLHATLIRRVREYRAVIQTAQKAFTATDRQAIVAARATFSRRLAAVAAQITATIAAINEKVR